MKDLLFKAVNDFNEVADDASHQIINIVVDAEKLLLAMLDKHDTNKFAKKLDTRYSDLFGFKNGNNYIFYEVGTNDANLMQAVFEHYNIDCNCRVDSDNNIILAVNKGRNEDNINKLIKDLKDGNVDLKAIYEEWALKGQKHEAFEIIKDDEISLSEEAENVTSDDTQEEIQDEESGQIKEENSQLDETAEEALSENNEKPDGLSKESELAEEISGNPANDFNTEESQNDSSVIAENHDKNFDEKLDFSIADETITASELNEETYQDNNSEVSYSEIEDECDITPKELEPEESKESNPADNASANEQHIDSSVAGTSEESRLRDERLKRSEDEKIREFEEQRDAKENGFERAAFNVIGTGADIFNQIDDTATEVIRSQHPSTTNNDIHTSSTATYDSEVSVHQVVNPETNYVPEHVSNSNNVYLNNSSSNVSSITPDLTYGSFSVSNVLKKDAYDRTKLDSMGRIVGNVFDSANSQAYHQTENYHGKKSLSGASTLAAERAHATLNRHASAAFASRIAIQETKTGKTEGIPQLLNNFLTANNCHYYGFQTKSDTEKTYSEIAQVLCNKKLATKRGDGTYDFSRINSLLSKAKREDPKALAELNRALGFVNKDFKMNEKSIKDMKEVIKNLQISESAKKNTLRSKQKLSDITMRKMFGETELYKGIKSLQQTTNRAKGTYKIAKTTVRLTGKIAVTLLSVAPPVRKLRGNIRTTTEARKLKAIDKRNLKRSARIQKRETRKSNRHLERLNKINARRLAKGKLPLTDTYWRRIAASAFFTRHKVRILKAQNIFHAIRSHGILAITSRFLDFKNLIRTKLIKLCGIAIIAVICLTTAFEFLSVITVGIPALWDSDSDDVLDSPLGKAYEKLLDEQTRWIENMKDAEVSSGYFQRGSLYYTDQYLDAATYASKIEHVVSYNATKRAFICNPFDFEPVDTSIYKTITKFDGGTEVYVEGYTDPTKTSNIKEILSMCQVYFDHDTSSTDNDTSSTYSSNVHDAATNSDTGYFDDDTEDDTTSARGFKRYSKELFRESHQEVVELEYIVLPTDYSLSMGTTAAAMTTENENLFSYDLITECPDADENGCSSYDDFYYKKTSNGLKIGIYGTDGLFHALDSAVYPTSSSCHSLNSIWGTSSFKYLQEQILNNSSCYNYGYYSNAGAITYSKWTETVQEAADTLNNTQSYLINNAGLTGNLSNAKLTVYDTEQGFLYVISATKEDVETNTYTHEVPSYDKNGKPEMQLDLLTGKEVQVTHEETVTEYRVKSTPYTIWYNWSCSGGHSGKFCGGHLRAKITGKVYAVAAEQVDEDNQVIEEKIADGEYIHTYPLKTTVDMNKVKSAVDIFDIDSAIIHSTELPSWSGWTEDNMSLALIKYTQDWTDLYGIDIPNGLGGPAHDFANPFHFNWKTEPNVAITEYYGPRINPISGISEIHRGLDIGAPTGTPVYSVCEGTVTFAGYKSSQGNYVTIEDSEGYTVHYMHLNEIDVNVGDVVTTDTQIGTVGSTGDSTGPHLHLAISKGTEYVNPIFFVSQYYAVED